MSDILPTSYMAAVMAEIKPSNIVAIFGCGPVGLFAIACAQHLGAALGWASSLDCHQIQRLSRGAVVDPGTILRFIRGPLHRRTVLHQLHHAEQPDRAHIADRRMPLLKPLKLVPTVRDEVIVIERTAP